MSATQLQEYDAFGPWILPVRTTEDVPPLFRPAGVDVARSTVAFKVPRNVARRDAVPGMDLYDHLLALEGGALTVVSRTGDPGPGFTVRRVPAGAVAGVRDTVDLLDGRLAVYDRDGGSVRIGYNGSAAATVGELVDHLTATLPSRRAPAGPGVALGRGDLGRDDVDLVAFLGEVRGGRPGGRLLAVQHRTRLRPTGVLARVGHRLSPATLPATLVHLDDTTLEVLSRAEPVVRGRAPDRSLSRLVLPAAAVELHAVTPHRRYADVVEAELGVGAARFVVPLVAGGDAVRALTALSGG